MWRGQWPLARGPTWSGKTKRPTLYCSLKFWRSFDGTYESRRCSHGGLAILIWKTKALSPFWHRDSTGFRRHCNTTGDRPQRMLHLLEVCDNVCSQLALENLWRERKRDRTARERLKRVFGLHRRSLCSRYNHSRVEKSMRCELIINIYTIIRVGSSRRGMSSTIVAFLYFGCCIYLFLRSKRLLCSTDTKTSKFCVTPRKRFF